jgi:hypothetical protein
MNELDGAVRKGLDRLDRPDARSRLLTVLIISRIWETRNLSASVQGSSRDVRLIAPSLSLAVNPLTIRRNVLRALSACEETSTHNLLYPPPKRFLDVCHFLIFLDILIAT